MLESWAYKQAEEAIYLKLCEEYPRQVQVNGANILRKVAEQSLREFISDKCQTCNGRASITVNKLKITCEDCSGSGIRRYTDFERARYTQLALGRIKTLQRHFRFSMDLMMTLDRQVNFMMAEQLER